MEGWRGKEDPERRMIPEEPEALQGAVEISTPRGTVRGILYPVEGARGAMVMVGGAGGDTTGPSGTYEELSGRLQADGSTALRLEYRAPNHLEECTYDVRAAVDALGGRGAERVVLVGWSFGGAVVISGGAASERVVGVATVASQAYGAAASGSFLLRRACCSSTAPPTACCRTGSPKTCTLERVNQRSWSSSPRTGTA